MKKLLIASLITLSHHLQLITQRLAKTDVFKQAEQLYAAKLPAAFQEMQRLAHQVTPKLSIT